jgi:hypothetical protein
MEADQGPKLDCSAKGKKNILMQLRLYRSNENQYLICTTIAMKTAVNHFIETRGQMGRYNLRIFRLHYGKNRLKKLQADIY